MQLCVDECAISRCLCVCVNESVCLCAYFMCGLVSPGVSGNAHIASVYITNTDVDTHTHTLIPCCIQLSGA